MYTHYYRPQYLATPVIVLQDYTWPKVGWIKITHATIGEVVGRITAVHDTKNPQTDYVDIEYYDPKTNNPVSTQFSAIDLSAPQRYFGPIPPQQVGPKPNVGGGRWVFVPGLGMVWVP